MAKLYTGQLRGRLVRPLLARHDLGCGRGDLQLRAPRLRAGHARQPDACRRPTPTGRRSGTPTAATTGERELDYGFALVDAQSDGQPGRLHRRAHPVLGRHHRTAARLPRRAQGEVRGARDAADPRRGADRAGPHRHHVRVRARRRRARTSSRCRRPSAPACRSPPWSPAARSRSVCHERGFLFFTTHVSDPLAAAVRWHGARRHRARRAGRARRRRSAAGCGTRLLDLQDRYDVVGDVRGRGLLQGIELVTDKATKDAGRRARAAVTAACLERGLHMNIVQLPGMGGIFRIAPPLTDQRGRARHRPRHPRGVLGGRHVRLVNVTLPANPR